MKIRVWSLVLILSHLAWGALSGGWDRLAASESCSRSGALSEELALSTAAEAPAWLQQLA